MSMRDPLYRKILEGLEGSLDPNLFEECAADLLRDAFPSLVPIHGGRDAGMDGAIADGEGEPYPLIVTTDQSPIRNLTKNLRSYRFHKDGEARRKVVFATNRALTAIRRRNLEKRATDEGFTLVQIFERRALADRLYRASAWRKALLGLPWDPPALTAIPRTRRPLLDLELVGREADLEWLQSTSGDRLVCGEPGAGKTFLLRQLVQEGGALFLASEDWAAVANAVRDQGPDVILVDDAHLEPERLDRLRQVRQGIDAEFDIVASSWPSGKDEVAEALGGLACDKLRCLELLTRKEILEVIRQSGVDAPDEYLLELVNQSANKPGLAVTLSVFALQGDWWRVLTGEALQRNLMSSMRRVLGEDPTLPLAMLSLGGDAGITVEAVAETLERPRSEIWDLAVRKLGGTGVIAETDDRLRVEPKVLRFALLKEVLFSSGSRPFDYRESLNRAPSPASGVRTLVEAALRQVPVPLAELRDLVKEYDSGWGDLARLDRDSALWVLKNHPGGPETAAVFALRHAPVEAVPWLLKQAETATGRQSSNPRHPLRLLKDWLMALPVSEVFQRRVATVQAVRSYLAAGGPPRIALEAYFASFSPLLEGHTPDATGSGIKVYRAAVPEEVIARLAELWTRSWPEVGKDVALDAGLLNEAETLLWKWIEPDVLGQPVASDRKKKMRRMACQILEDVGKVARSPGMVSSLTRLATRLEMQLPAKPDPVFQTLYPAPPTEGDWQAQREMQQQEALRLVDRWQTRDPGDVARDFAFYAAEANEMGHRGEALATFVSRELADRAERPDRWLTAFLEQGVPPDLVSPFLEKTARSRRPDWKALVTQCLESDEYAIGAADVILRLEDPPAALLDAALDVLRKFPQWVETAALRQEIPVPALKKVLSHPDWKLALAVAGGEWTAAPRGQVRDGLRQEWRQAVLRAKSREYEAKGFGLEQAWLRDILETDGDLALDWLRARLADPDLPDSVHERGAFVAAIGALAEDPRKTLLSVLLPLAQAHRFLVGELVQYLVSSTGIYAQLLASHQLDSVHLKPLEGTPPDALWIELAELALQAGYEPKQVAGCSFHFTGASWGHGVEHWGKWESAFAEMEKTATGPLREVAKHGLQFARELVGGARKREREYEVTGHRF